MTVCLAPSDLLHTISLIFTFANVWLLGDVYVILYDAFYI